MPGRSGTGISGRERSVPFRDPGAVGGDLSGARPELRALPCHAREKIFRHRSRLARDRKEHAGVGKGKDQRPSNVDRRTERGDDPLPDEGGKGAHADAVVPRDGILPPVSGVQKRAASDRFCGSGAFRPGDPRRAPAGRKLCVQTYGAGPPQPLCGDPHR